VSAFAPSGAGVVWAGCGLLAATLAVGFALPRLPSPAAARWLAWGWTAAAVVVAERLTAGEPPGFRMLGILGALLFGLKGVVAVADRAAGNRPLGAAAWLGFAAAWPGMRPRLFARWRGWPLPGAAALLGRGLAYVAAGAALVAAARIAVAAGASRLAGTLLILPGLSLLLHFGLFNVLAGGWRLAGVDARPLFRAPLASTSLVEFWGRRWNLAFSEMMALIVYRPLAPRLGRPGAKLAVFLASGVLHELAISLPVRAGFGLPLAYFALHGLAVTIEGRWGPARRGGRGGWAGHLWTLAWLALPLPLLFHPPFLAGVVWPLLGPGAR
jgi:Membrane bound O-acyl transferase family